MSARRRPHAAALVAVLALSAAARPAFAEPKLLDDREMRGVWGQAAAPTLPVLPGTGGLPGVTTGGDGSDPASRLNDALMKGAIVTLLDQKSFLAAWRAAAGNDSTPATYDGRPVVQIEITAPPVTMSFDGNALFSALAGGAPYHGPSAGTFTMTNVDARGTTLWVWGH